MILYHGSNNFKYNYNKFKIIDGQSVVIPTYLATNPNVAKTYGTLHTLSLDLKYLKVLEVNEFNGERLTFPTQIWDNNIESIFIREAGKTVTLTKEDSVFKIIFDWELKRIYGYNLGEHTDIKNNFDEIKDYFKKYGWEKTYYSFFWNYSKNRIINIESFYKQNIEHDVIIYKNIYCSMYDFKSFGNSYLTMEEKYELAEEHKNGFCNELTDVYMVFASQRLRLSNFSQVK